MSQDPSLMGVEIVPRDGAAPGLPDPGLPLVLTLTLDVNGKSNILYTTTPAYAVSFLRELADNIEDKQAAEGEPE